MGKSVIIKTNLPNPPEELRYCWREPYEVFPVGKDGVIEGLSTDHPRWLVLQREWKLEVIEVKGKDNEKVKPLDLVEEVA